MKKSTKLDIEVVFLPSNGEVPPPDDWPDDYEFVSEVKIVNKSNTPVFILVDEEFGIVYRREYRRGVNHEWTPSLFQFGSCAGGRPGWSEMKPGVMEDIQ